MERRVVWRRRAGQVWRSRGVFFHVGIATGLAAKRGKDLGIVTAIERARLGLVFFIAFGNVERAMPENNGPEH